MSLNRPRGDLDDQWPGAREIRKADDVRRGGIGHQQAEFVTVAVVQDQVGIPGPEHLLLFVLPLGKAHQRQRPEVGLCRPLEIHLVEKRLDGRLRWIAALELEPADAGVGARQHGPGRCGVCRLCLCACMWSDEDGSNRRDCRTQEQSEIHEFSFKYCRPRCV
jgi:hypothetical protein